MDLKSAAAGSMLDLEGVGSKERLKSFWHFRECYSTPPTSAESWYYSQMCLNSMKNLSWINVTLKHFRFSPQMQKSISIVCIIPER